MTTTLTAPEPQIKRTAIEGAVMLPLQLIKPNPWNRQADAARLAEIGHSISKHGVMQPVLVRPIEGAKPGQPLYELIAGERRWRGAQLAKLAEIPALLKQATDIEVQELMLVENLERERLHELDEADGYRRLLRREDGLQGFATIDELATQIGKSRSYIVQRLKLQHLCPAAVKAFRTGELTFSLALRIARIESHADQADATEHILRGWGGNPMSARDADAYIHRAFMLELDKAVFKITDATLVPEAGSCRTCPKRTGSNPDLFDDIKKGDTCTDGACYARKEAAHHAALRAAAEAKGMRVISGAEAKKQSKDYLALDEKHYKIDATKPLRKLLGKADIEPVLIEDEHTKQLVEMVPRTQALAALKATGVLKTERMPTTGASERDAEAKRKREMAWRTAAAEACVEAARGDAGATVEYRSSLIGRLALLLWSEMSSDTNKRVTKLMGWPPLKSRWDKGPGITAEEQIRRLNDAELCRFFTAALCAGELHISTFQTISKPESLHTTAEALGVDVAAIKEAQRDLKRVAKPAKPAKTAGPTPVTALKEALRRENVKERVERATRARQANERGVKYRNDATGETWTGRGLQPAWLKAALLNGRKLEAFAVTPTPASHVTAAGAAVGLAAPASTSASSPAQPAEAAA